MILPDFSSVNLKVLSNSQNRCVLAIDSSTQLASVALQFQGQIIFYEECFRQKSHSEWLNGAVDRATLKLPKGWEDIELLAVTHGPGSFTGVRVATNFIKTVAFAKDKPIVSFSSLDILAQNVPKHPEAELLLCAINAFKNMSFVALYRQDSQGLQETLLAPGVVEMTHLAEIIEVFRQRSSSTKVQVVGDSVIAYPSYFGDVNNSYFVRTEGSRDFPLASALMKKVNQNWGQWPLKHWRELVPTYFRASAAEENLRQK